MSVADTPYGIDQAPPARNLNLKSATSSNVVVAALLILLSCQNLFTSKISSANKENPFGRYPPDQHRMDRLAAMYVCFELPSLALTCM